MNNVLIELGLIALTFLVNIPLGMWRASVRKFSLSWLVAVHAAVPLVVALRLWLSISYWWVPVLIAISVLAQWLGSRLYQQRKYLLANMEKVGEE